MNWTQTDDHALRVLVDVAAHPDAPIREIGDRTAIPSALVAKVVQALARASLVETTRGRGGGVRLARDPAAISLLDVVEAIQGPLCFLRCPRRGKGCPQDTDCAVYRLSLELQESLAARLQRVRIADLAHSCSTRVQPPEPPPQR
ncbi:MAG: RrF2 family transcriptional regulator [Armatimonadota bacterium]